MDFECRMAPEVLNLGGPRMKFLDVPNRYCALSIFTLILVFLLKLSKANSFFLARLMTVKDFGKYLNLRSNFLRKITQKT